jgi:hypothetical protein
MPVAGGGHNFAGGYRPAGLPRRGQRALRLRKFVSRLSIINHCVMKGRGCTLWSFSYAVLSLAAVSLSAAPPEVTVLSPRYPDSSVNQGDVVYLKADARDSDGTVTRVEFYDQATNLLAIATNAPFEGWWTNQVNSTYYYFLTAVAIDDAAVRK